MLTKNEKKNGWRKDHYFLKRYKIEWDNMIREKKKKEEEIKKKYNEELSKKQNIEAQYQAIVEVNAKEDAKENRSLNEPMKQEA